MNSPIEISDLESYITYIDGTATYEKSHLYRGQEDEEWPVTCSALRRLESNQEDPRDELFYQYRDYMLKIVDEVQLEYPSIYRSLSPLECLAHLQHNGVATGLIDFTFNPLVALWFACDYQKENTAGKVFILENRPEQIEEIRTTQDLRKELEDFFDVTEEKWHLWSPTLDSQVVDTQRMTMQQSAFLFGAPEMHNQMFAEEIVIPYASKKELRSALSKVGVSEETLFADHLGFLQRNTTEQPYDDGENIP